MTDNEIISIDEAIRHCYETYDNNDLVNQIYLIKHTNLLRN